MTHFLFDGDDTAPVTILLAHGAGASMDSPSMTATAKALAAAGFQVARFEFHYMAARRYGHRKPPPRAETVNPEYIKAIADLRGKGVAGPLIIGGKSMGGRVASMVADEMFAKGEISGLLCLHWDLVMDPAGRFAPLRLRERRLPASYLATVFGGMAALIAAPYTEELIRCARSRRAAKRKGADREAANPANPAR